MRISDWSSDVCSSDLTLVRKDQGNPVDPLKPWRASTSAAEISFAIVGVFIEYEKDEVDGTIVKRGDKSLILAAKDVDDTAPANHKVEDYDEEIGRGSCGERGSMYVLIMVVGV